MSCVMQFQFHERIAQLVYTFPEDATTSTGALFWSAPKRFPQPLTFNPADPSHVAFAQAGAILKAQVHNITIPAWGSDLDKVGFSCLPLLACPSKLQKSSLLCGPDLCLLSVSVVLLQQACLLSPAESLQRQLIAFSCLWKKVLQTWWCSCQCSDCFNLTPVHTVCRCLKQQVR